MLLFSGLSLGETKGCQNPFELTLITDDYQNASTNGHEAATGEEGPFRVIRGGSWRDDSLYLHPAYRNGLRPDVRYDDLGFRVLRIPK